MKTNLLALALIDNAQKRALKAEAQAAAMYTSEQLDVAFAAMRDGTHQYYPAAAHYLGQAERAWQDYTRFLMADRRNARDARIGQLQLAL